MNIIFFLTFDREDNFLSWLITARIVFDAVFVIFMSLYVEFTVYFWRFLGAFWIDRRHYYYHHHVFLQYFCFQTHLARCFLVCHLICPWTMPHSSVYSHFQVPIAIYLLFVYDSLFCVVGECRVLHRTWEPSGVFGCCFVTLEIHKFLIVCGHCRNMSSWRVVCVSFSILLFVRIPVAC